MNRPLRHLIIGAGPAGFSAAEEIIQHTPDAIVKIVSHDLPPYYSRPGLLKWLGGNISEDHLFPQPDHVWKTVASDLDRDGARKVVKLGIEKGMFKYRCEVMPDELGAGPHAYWDKRYDRLLIATGSRPKLSPWKDVDGVDSAEINGVHTIGDRKSVRDLEQALRRARNPIVVGGGLLSLQIVQAILDRHPRHWYRRPEHMVCLIMRSGHIWRKLIKSEAAVIEAALGQRGVLIQCHRVISEVLSEERDGRKCICGVRTKPVVNNGNGMAVEIPCDLLIAALGVVPQSKLAKDMGIKLTPEGHVEVDRSMRSTSHGHHGVFAAGDVAAVVPNRHQPETVRTDRQWWVAVTQGRIAGANMAEVPTQERRTVPVWVTELGGYHVTAIGELSRYEDWPPARCIPRLPHRDKPYWRFVFDDEEHLVGAVLLGNNLYGPMISTIAQLVIEHKDQVGPCREKFLRSDDPQKVLRTLLKQRIINSR